MKKTLAVLALGAAAAIALAGCGHEHQWVGATCTEPQKCLKCDETQGEPLGHDYKEATCEEPQTCKRCGETVGEALGHKFSEADYEHAATCSVCGAVDGEPLQADFVKYGLDDRIHDKDGKAEYKTTCYEDDSLETVGEIEVTEYETFESDDDHEALEGYGWKKFVAELTFSDDNANTSGVLLGDCLENYYDIKGHDDSSVEDDKGISFTTTWQGEEYDQCYEESPKKEWGKWTKDNTITLTTLFM